MRRALGAGLALAASVFGLAGCDVNTVSRTAQPAVLTGAQLPDLVGQAPGAIVAFRRDRPGGTPTWTQIPVQVDERKVVPFGTQPGSNTAPGVDGTVYGNGSGGPAALQYADPDTFVGADGDAAFDADDELTFMISDAGGMPRSDERAEPRGVVPGSGVAVQIDDPRAGGNRGWVHLFVSAGALDPAAGQDYVDYDFQLASGDYRTTYRRAAGPNPETSQVVTPTYRIGYSDRWYEDSWRVTAPGASGADILDGHKNQFAVDTCGRSNKTFASAEGAFVANIDGPVRGIRSYIGANSGPKTQRTHLMYRDQEVIVTNLRVHAIPGVMDFIDYSAAAVGMTYRSSTAPNGATIDGKADAVPSGVAAWETATGPQGTVLTTSRYAMTAGSPVTGWFHRDQASPPEQQCWGDGSFLGASGPSLTGGIPNTDPQQQPFADLVGTRVVHFLPPMTDGAQLSATAADLAADHDTPVKVTVTRYVP